MKDIVDIVERLRRWFESNQHPDRANEIMREAADEIDTLRAEVERLVSCNNLTILRAEVERLRAETRTLRNAGVHVDEKNETLRAEVERLKAPMEATFQWATLAENKALRAENERLREALEEMITVKVARAALQEKK